MSTTPQACSVCSHEFPATGRFCPACGTPSGGGTILCEECGTRNTASTRFCVACGTPLSPVVAEETVEAVAMAIPVPIVDSAEMDEVALAQEAKRKERKAKAKALMEANLKKGAPLKDNTPESALVIPDLLLPFEVQVPTEEKEIFRPSTAEKPTIVHDTPTQRPSLTTLAWDEAIHQKLVETVDQLILEGLDNRYGQFLKDKFYAKALLSNSPFQLPTKEELNR